MCGVKYGMGEMGVISGGEGDFFVGDRDFYVRCEGFGNFIFGFFDEDGVVFDVNFDFVRNGNGNFIDVGYCVCVF